MKFPNEVLCLVSVSFNEEHAALLSLLVDDDLEDRCNRGVLLKPEYKYVGIGSGMP